MTISNTQLQRDDENYNAYPAAMDIGQVARALWSGALIIVLFFSACVGLGILYLHLAIYSYSANLSVVPTQSQNRNLAGRFGDLASIAGIDISPGQNVSPFTLYPDVLKSRVVADDLAKQSPVILRKIFFTEWNAQLEKWQEPHSTVRDAINFVKPFLGVPIIPWAPPDGGDLQQFITEKVDVSQNTRKPVITISFNNSDPEFAKQFVQALHETTDRVLREMTLDRSSKYADYIEGKLATVRVAELRQVLMNSLGEQETLIMMSSSNTPFAAQPLGAAERSVRPTQPKPALVLLLTATLGLMLGGATAILWDRSRRTSARRSPANDSTMRLDRIQEA